jgi:hypothetical protein
MNCYDCHQDGTTTPAIGICEQCGAGICPDHSTQDTQHHPMTLPMGRIVRPQMRQLVCTECHHALSQPEQASRKAS